MTILWVRDLGARGTRQPNFNMGCVCGNQGPHRYRNGVGSGFAGPPMGGVGRTQGPHRYFGGAWSGRPSAGVSLGDILGGGVSAFSPRSARRRAPPRRTPYGWDLTLALHRYRVGAESGRRPGTVAVLVVFCMSPRTTGGGVSSSYILGSGLSLALHRYRGGAESGRRPGPVAVLVVFCMSARTTGRGGRRGGGGGGGRGRLSATKS